MDIDMVDAIGKGNQQENLVAKTAAPTDPWETQFLNGNISFKYRRRDGWWTNDTPHQRTEAEQRLVQQQRENVAAR